jgi:methylenetetrahydrofolate reductase (NADPH)
MLPLGGAYGKVLIYDCKDCGDCALTDLAYSCPMSQCPKNQRNGACGGSYNGWCEVYPGKRKCVYVKAYARLKKYGEEIQLDSYHVAPCNWDLYQTSSWINFYLGKDHSAKRLGLKKQCK